jgi:hypothetical protein
MLMALDPRTLPAGNPVAAAAGMPGDRDARLAASKALIDLQLTFLHALQGTPGTEWLQQQVRAAEEPVDLWLLRAPVLAALAGASADQRQRRQRLRRGLASVFPELDEISSNYIPL